jgi:hypothetical protein
MSAVGHLTCADAEGRVSVMEGTAWRWTGAVAVVLVVATACAREAGDLGGGTADGVEPEELVQLLLAEEDDVDATSYGPRPMTATDTGDGYYRPPPFNLCDTGGDVDLLAPDDIHAYLGDGGDYLTIDHWIAGESVGSATARFEQGVEAIEECLPVEEVEVSDAEVDEARRYDFTGPGSDEIISMVYARHGGVVMLLGVESLSLQRYDADDVDHLVDVTLGKLTSIGRVQVST